MAGLNETNLAEICSRYSSRALCVCLNNGESFASVGVLEELCRVRVKCMLYAI